MHSSELSLFKIVIILIFSFLGSSCHNHQSIPDNLTLNEFIDGYSKYLVPLWAALDLDNPELIEVKNAIERSDINAASIELIKYYDSKPIPSGLQLELPEKSISNVEKSNIIKTADQILADIFTFQGVSGKAKRLANGRIDWSYHGPKGDKEWSRFLNRHYIFRQLLDAYHVSGDSRYVAFFNRSIIDWVLSNPTPKKALKTPQWRVMEVGSRALKSWGQIFYGFRDADAFSTPAKLLMLLSLADQQAYLLEHHEAIHNHAVKELSGLAHIAVAFPEFRDADRWIDHAIRMMGNELHFQVYPDGTQKELSSFYHDNVFRYFREFINIVRGENRKLPKVFHRKLEKMADYTASAMKPNGHNVQNNDADRRSVVEITLENAEEYSREDWRFIATQGRAGNRPESKLSNWYPWAGQLFSRSGWHEDSLYSYFDMGPWGISHQHNDKLHLSVYAFGSDLLVDAGRYAYKSGSERDYFVSSASHNVILIDGEGQNPREEEWLKPSQDEVAMEPEFDFALSSFDAGFKNLVGTAIHQRALFFIRDSYWLVVDRIITDKPREIEVLWHFDPHCDLQFDGNSVVSVNDDIGNLRIKPVSDSLWTINLVEGQTSPEIQGWQSPEYNEMLTSPVAIYSKKITNSALFAWILLPGKGKVTPVKASLLSSPLGTIRILVQREGHPNDEIALNFTDKGGIVLTKDRFFTGRLAWIRNDDKATVVGGTIKNKDGEIISQHAFSRFTDASELVDLY